MIIGFLILIVLTSIAFRIEAKHDRLISSFPQSEEDNKKWHRLDWFYLATIGLGVSALSGNFVFGMSTVEFALKAGTVLNTAVTLSMLKILVFNPSINRSFNQKWNYVSDKGIEGRFKGKETLYYLLALIALLINITSYLCINAFILK